MMTAVGVPGTAPLTSHYNVAMASNPGFIGHNGSNASTGTTTSSLCSTPVNLFGQNGLNAAAAQALSFMQAGGIQYYPTQLSSMTSPYGTTMTTTPSLGGSTNAFEGFPIVLLPQNGSATLPLTAVQKQLLAQQQIAAAPKIDTSSMFASPPIINFRTYFSEHHHVFVGDLSSEIDSTMLKNAFSKFGEIS